MTHSSSKRPHLQPESEGVFFGDDGYLLETQAWSPDLAKELAQQENLILTPLHWEIIHYTREFYLQHSDMPKMRALLSYLKQKPEYAQTNSTSIHQLFPLSPALQIAKIAGLPKPIRCL
jgi:tRNA 2-thiouridine synthesizing protein E